MSHYKRSLDLAKLLKNKSFFLFGPRSTGKTTMIQKQLSEAVVYDLLDAEVYKKLLQRPKLLEEENPDSEKIIVIDEIQKLPTLLDEVHRLISKENRRFLLTGSSARKLRKDGTNLLAGRAWRADLFSLTSKEITNFDLLRYLNYGGLPQVYLSEYPEEELRAYTAMYLKEEIQSEALTRNLQAFAAFLDIMALNNAEEVNFQSLASDCGVSVATLKSYMQILEDTLLGFSLPGYRATKKRKAISRVKHFLFDLGVNNSLARRGEIKEKSELFGKAFEHFIVLETRAYLSYARSQETLSYWRSLSQFEVDLLIGDRVAIEIKATSMVQDKHLKGLRALKEEGIFERYIVVSQDTRARRIEDGIEVLPWQDFLKELWSGEVV